MARYKKINGYVWCDAMGGIHQEDDDNYEDCYDADHRAVYALGEEGETF